MHTPPSKHHQVFGRVFLTTVFRHRVRAHGKFVRGAGTTQTRKKAVIDSGMAGAWNSHDLLDNFPSK